MKREDIEKLLDAYYEGTISEEEEKALLYYFQGDDIDPELADERLVFIGLHNTDEVPISPSFETKLESLITELATNEEKPKKAIQQRAEKYNLWMRAASTAACLAIMFSIGFFFLGKQDRQEPVNAIVNNQPKDTFSNPEEAYAEAEKALLLVSANLNKGLSQLASAQENIEKSNKIVNKSLNNIK